MLFNAPGQESTDNVQGCVETMLNSEVFAPFQQAKQLLGRINDEREAVMQKLVEDTKKKGRIEPQTKGKVTKLKKKTVSTMKKRANRKLKMPQKTKQMNPLAKNRHDKMMGVCVHMET